MNFLILKLYSQWLHLTNFSDINGTKGNHVAVAVLVAVDDSTKAEFEGNATETGSFIAVAAAWLWVS